MTPVCIGLVGAGFMAAAHAECYRQDPRVRLVRVASGRLESAQRLASRFGIAQVSARWQDVIEDPEVHAVDVVAPNHLHAEVAIAAAAAGKAVLIEKPLARTVAEADRVVDAIARAAVTAVYAENRRFSPALLRIREAVTDGTLGRPRFLRVTELGSGPGHGEWFWDPRRSGGGALLDMGIHGLGAAEWLMADRIVSVQASAGQLRWKERLSPEVEDTMLTLAVFSGGGLAQFACSWAYVGGLEIRFELTGTAGTAVADLGRGASGLSLYSEVATPGPVGAPGPHQAVPQGWSFPLSDEWRQKGHAGEIRHFIDCVVGEAEPTCTVEDGRRCLVLAEAIGRAAGEGKAVAVPPPNPFPARKAP